MPPSAEKLHYGPGFKRDMWATTGFFYLALALGMGAGIAFLSSPFDHIQFPVVDTSVDKLLTAGALVCFALAAFITGAKKGADAHERHFRDR